MLRAKETRFQFLRYGPLALVFVLAVGCDTQRQAAEPEAKPSPEPDKVQSAESDQDLAIAGNNSRPNYKNIDLEYVGPDEPCVEATPDYATTYKSKKPKKVRFWVDPEDTYYWTIAYDAAKPGATGDYFGALDDIKCSDNNVKSNQHSGVPANGTYTWPYKVTVYECVNGDKGSMICETDPGVRIKD